MPNFVRWFPSLHQLHLLHIDIDETAIGVSFPHLKRLDIDVSTNYDTDRNGAFTIKNVASFLHANHQLGDLKIHLNRGTTLDELLNAITENKSISALTMVSSDGNVTNVNIIDLKRLMNEYPLMEKLKLPHHRFTADAAIMVTQQLNSLNQFKFRVADRAECDHLLNELKDKWQTHVVEVESEFQILLSR